MKRIIINILAAIIPFMALCQIPQMSRTMLSPNAASLGEYGDVPVSPFTGIPQIDIPLYELKISNYKLPLVMSYHAGGVRPEQHPGWTGLGWSLMAGGCISRVVNGINDEYHNVDNKTGSPYYKNKGYLYRYKMLDLPEWNNKDFLNYYLNIVARSDGRVYDTEPDKFSFNFCGYSGNFYLNHKGEWQVQCDKPLKIIFEDKPENFTLLYGKESPSFSTTGTDMTYDGMGSSHMFKKFTIISEDGTQYIFGEDDNAIEYSVPFFYQKALRLTANTWNLTKIILPNNEEIKFTYERGDFIAQMFLAVMATINYKIVADDGSIFDSGCNNSTMPGLTGSTNGQLILPSYLKYIEGGNTRVEFYRKPSVELEYNMSVLCWDEVYKFGTDRLDEFLPILQYNGNYEGEVNYPNCLNGLKYYQLREIMIKDSGQDYRVNYSFNYSKDYNSRLMLNSIVEYSYSTRAKVYKFEYDRPDLLPGYVSNKTDHWGFYNNRYAYYNDLGFYPNYREPNEAVATYGTLTKVIYPTGGYSRFVFEPHDYLMSINQQRTACSSLLYKQKAGGIRIKEIINSPTGKPEDEFMSRRYYYVTDYLQNKNNSSKSSGVLGALAKYWFDYTVHSQLGGFKTRMEIFSSQSVLPGTTNACGSHVGYSEVIEEYPDGSFSRYKYTNFDDGHFDQPCDMTLQVSRTLYEPYSSREQERGLLKSREDYDSNSRLKYSMDYEYEKSSPDSSYVRALKANYTKPQCDEVGEGFIEGTVYRFYTYLMRKVKETEKKYDSPAPRTEIRTYSYNDDNMIKKITRASGDGKMHIIQNIYPGNCTYSPSTWMRDGHVLSSLMETSESVLINSTEYPVRKTRYNYSKKGTHNFTIGSIEEATGNNNYETQISYQYDSKNNPKLISPLSGVQTVYVWGLKHEYLLAEIKNSYTLSVETYLGSIETFGESLKPDYDKLDNLRKQLPEAEITTYRYKPLIGLTQSTDPRGVKHFYEYDHMNRLIVVKDDKGNIVETYNYNYKK